MKLFCLLFSGLFLFPFSGSKAQQTENSENKLFTAGYASAFIGGLYDGYFPYRKLKQQGDFGLGAPDKLDGELIMLGGKIYQTRHTGHTFQVDDEGLTPFALACFFHPDKRYKPQKKLTKDQLYALIDSLTQNKNGIFAIHVKGKFKSVKTRAFPPVAHKPYIPLARLLDTQHFFDFNNIEGDFVGYYIPPYMQGANITGYHFHFLSAKKNAGGHVIDFLTDDISISIDPLNGFTVDLPQTSQFEHFDLMKNRSEEIKNVENGKKE